MYLTMTDWRVHSRMAYLRSDPGTLNAQIPSLGLFMLTPRLNLTSIKRKLAIWKQKGLVRFLAKIVMLYQIRHTWRRRIKEFTDQLFFINFSLYYQCRLNLRFSNNLLNWLTRAISNFVYFRELIEFFNLASWLSCFCCHWCVGSKRNPNQT